jgi:hypothetical protein
VNFVFYYYSFLSTKSTKKKHDCIGSNANGGGVALNGGDTNGGGVALNGGDTHPGCNIALGAQCFNKTRLC